mmetsp:Transcript_720/g.2770  ORF Transcript_720/g.2770 Transcript_720/m.2770 type:complete len:282 (+) Transcript_720:1874-2719(+)
MAAVRPAATLVAPELPPGRGDVPKKFAELEGAVAGLPHLEDPDPEGINRVLQAVRHGVETLGVHEEGFLQGGFNCHSHAAEGRPRPSPQLLDHPGLDAQVGVQRQPGHQIPQVPIAMTVLALACLVLACLSLPPPQLPQELRRPALQPVLKGIVERFDGVREGTRAVQAQHEGKHGVHELRAAASESSSRPLWVPHRPQPKPDKVRTHVSNEFCPGLLHFLQSPRHASQSRRPDAAMLPAVTQRPLERPHHVQDARIVPLRQQQPQGLGGMVAVLQRGGQA